MAGDENRNLAHFPKIAPIEVICQEKWRDGRRRAAPAAMQNNSADIAGSGAASTKRLSVVAPIASNPVWKYAGVKPSGVGPKLNAKLWLDWVTVPEAEPSGLMVKSSDRSAPKN